MSPGNSIVAAWKRGSVKAYVSFALLLIISSAGCATPAERMARQKQRFADAKALFDQTTKLYHLPSAEAQGATKEKLLAQAAAGYEQLLRQYPEQINWCAQSLRSLANVRAEQNRIDEAVQLYERVNRLYPREDWEVLQSWRSAADLLWEHGRRESARAFYRRIVERFDHPDASSIVRLVVRGSQTRLKVDAP